MEKQENKKTRYTPAQAKSAKKYLSGLAKYQIRMSEEQKEQIKAAAEKENKSINQFILDCILEHLKKQ